MKQQIIEVLDITGASIACYETDTMESLISLYKGLLFNITSKGLKEYDSTLEQYEEIYEKFRFVVASDSQQKDILRNLQPVKCYLRNQDMKTKIIHINPYQSVGYLREKVQFSKETEVKLVIANKQLTQDRESLVKHIHEDVIIHVIQALQSQVSQLLLYVKEPGPDSKTYNIDKISAQAKIRDLILEVAKQLEIPYQFIYLVFGGRVLPKDGSITQFSIHNKACIYAVDSRKYMKKIPLSQYNRRVKQVRKVKQCNKLIVQKADQKRFDKKSDKPANREQKKTRYAYQSQGTILEDLGQDNKYFEQNQMNLQSELFDQFHRRGNKLEQDSRVRAPLSSEITHQYAHKEIFGEKQKFANVDIARDQNGNIVELTEVQHDDEGNTHKHKSKVFQQPNKLTLIETEEMIDCQGTIIRKQKDQVQIKQQQDGSTVKKETITIEEDDRTEITRKSLVQDREGNFIKSETKIIEIQNSQYGIRIHQQSQISQEAEEGVFQVAAVDKNTEIVKDQSGHTVTQSRQIRQMRTGQPTIVNNVRFDYGEREVSQKSSKNVINQQGAILRSELESYHTVKLAQGLTRREEESIMQEEGVKFTIYKQIYEDDQGNTLVEEVVTTENPQDEEIISTVYKRIVEEVEKDQFGNLHIHYKEIKQNNKGSSQVVEQEIVQDQNSLVFEKTSELVSKVTQQNGNTTFHEINRSQKPGEVIVIQRDSTLNAEGHKIRDETSQTVFIGEINSEIIRKETNIYVDEVEKRIIQQTIVQDAEGNITHAKGTFKRVQIDQKGIEQEVEVKSYELDSVQHGDYNKSYSQFKKEVIQDKEGNTLTLSQKVVQNQLQGIKVIKSEVFSNENGEILKESSRTVDIQNVAHGSIIKQENQSFTADQLIQEVTVTISDREGQVLEKTEKKLQITEHDGLITTNQTGAIRKLGETTIATVEKLEDSQGKVISQKSSTVRMRDTVEAVRQQAEKIAQVEATGKIKEIKHELIDDEEGNLHTIDKKVIDSAGKKIVIETDRMISHEGEVIKSTTEIIEQNEEDGKVKKIETQIIEEGCRVQVIESSQVNDKQIQLIGSNQLARQQNFDDLLGSIQRQSTTLEGIQVKLTDSVYNSTEIKNTGNKEEVLNSDSNSGQQVEGIIQKREDNREEEEEAMLPEEFNVVAIGKARSGIKLRIRYDQTVGEIGKKLSQLLGKPGVKINFFKDGAQFQDDEMVSDLEIGPGDKIYFTEE